MTHLDAPSPRDAMMHDVVAGELFSGRGNDCVGLEVELFVHRLDGARRLVHDDAEGVIETVARAIGGTILETPEAGPHVEMPNGGRITLEPAGQIEYSGPPHTDVSTGVADALDVIARIDSGLRMTGWCITLRGFDDTAGVQELVVPKPRYRAMDEYFNRIGPFGRMMMRRTCALQLNFDLGPVGTDQQRWRLANMIGPSMNALFANSPVTVGNATYNSYRYEIWRRLDPTRTGRLFDRPDLDPVSDYIRFALDATVMFVETDDGLEVPDSRLTFRRWMQSGWKGSYPDVHDWRRHLSTLFPDVRPKGWIEFRSIDAQPVEMIGAAAALVQTLLYDHQVRGMALERLERRDRQRSAEGEHGGFWQSDLSTGCELARLCADAIPDHTFRDRLLRFVDGKPGAFLDRLHSVPGF